MKAIRILTLFLAVLLMSLGSTIVAAQKISEEEVDQIKRQKELAVLKKEIAEAEAAELKAKFPEPKSTPLAGTTTINDGAVIESEMISYGAMARASNMMAAKIKASKPDANVIVIYDRETLNNLHGYRTASSQLVILKNNYCELLSPSAPTTLCVGGQGLGIDRMNVTPFAIAQSFVGGLVDLLALFRTNEDVKGHTFVMEDDALVSEVFRSIRKQYSGEHPALYYPAVFPPTLDINASSQFLALLEDIRQLRILAGSLADDLVETTAEIKKIEDAIKELKGKRKALEGQITEIVLELEGLRSRPVSARAKVKIASLEAKKATMKKSIDEIDGKLLEVSTKLADLKNKKAAILANLRGVYDTDDKVTELIARLRAYNQQFDQFVAALVQLNASGSNPLMGYLRAENLERIMSCEAYPGYSIEAMKSEKPRACESYWLQLKVLRAGGNNRIRTHLILDFFRGGNRLSHSGGAIVQYDLFDRNGRSQLSDVLAVYNDYVKSTNLGHYLRTVDNIDDLDVP